jgi:DMSO/TMAO reductase YedYZ molybdopterin-dependent catalytic subunit
MSDHDEVPTHPVPDDEDEARSRRWMLGAVATSSAMLALSFLGANIGALTRFALLPSRRKDISTNGLPVQTRATLAGVEAQYVLSPDFKIRIFGSAVTRPLALGIADLRARSGHRAELPIACVQGWSVAASWEGVPIRDLLAEAGVRDFNHVIVTSLQKRMRPQAMFTSARLNRAHALDPDTMLALKLNGDTLHINHGFPARLITPNQPGIMQTKWVEYLEVV